MAGPVWLGMGGKYLKKRQNQLLIATSVTEKGIVVNNRWACIYFIRDVRRLIPSC